MISGDHELKPGQIYKYWHEGLPHYMILLSCDEDHDDPNDNNLYWKTANFMQLTDKRLCGAATRFFTELDVRSFYGDIEFVGNIQDVKEATL